MKTSTKFVPVAVHSLKTKGSKRAADIVAGDDIKLADGRCLRVLRCELSLDDSHMCMTFMVGNRKFNAGWDLSIPVDTIVLCD